MPTAWFESMERLRSIQTEILRHAPFRDIGIVRNPGATPEAIRAAEARLGLPLPPSYREFLLQHDGWPRFFEGASLLGTDDLGTPRYELIARAAFEAAETPVPELCPPVLQRDLPRVVPFAADTEVRTLFAFHPEVRSETGEYEVVAWISELGIRCASFPEMLELLCDLAESELSAHVARSSELRKIA
ncbi:MAG TPA: SMI1/KNR4 family protein [Polyangiaceae bacterium]|nr:SMI1/KNR4 family protein [Polyangiaceae bacterium]